jgi:membrane protease YdiL (CAAX protease family)
MMTIKAFITRHPVATYYVLTFAISWGGMLAIGGLGGLSDPEWQSDPRLPFLGVAMLAGPSLAGLLMTGLVAGRAGYRALLARLLRWRVGVRWYAVALLTAPLVTAATLVPLVFISPVFLPAIVTADDKASLLLSALAMAPMVGILEELGWTGFAIPRLRARHSVLATGLIVGLPWGAWHFLAFWTGDSFSGALPLALLLVQLFSWLPAYRVLMVWVYDRTGSLLVAMLMHASLVAGNSIILGTSATGAALLTSILVGAAVWWVAVAALAMATHRQLARQPLRTRVA